MSLQFKDFIEQNEQLIRNGRVEDVRQNLSKVAKVKVERKYRAQLANIAKRVGLPEVALGLLFNIIRKDKDLAKDSTSKEKLEYASALLMIGAKSEALEILQTCDSQLESQVLLAQALCYFTTWDYNLAVPLLRDYISTESDEYFQIVGRLNLSAALLFNSNYEDSRRLAEEVLAYGQKHNLKMIQANALELLAQNAISCDGMTQAHKQLQAAEQLLGADFSRPALWIQKWRAMAHFMSGDKAAALQLIAQVHAKATEWNVYETVRDGLLFESVFLADRDAFLKLYFCTPFSRYRERACSLYARYNGAVEIPCYYTVGENDPTVDIKMGMTLDRQFELKPWQTQHRILVALTRDFIRPARVADIHASVYPGTYYNHLSTPHQIHELILRFRGTLQEQGLQAQVENTSAGYTLRTQCRLRIAAQMEGTLSKEDVLFERFSHLWGTSFFKTKNVMQILAVSRNTATQIINSASRKGLLQPQGQGRSTGYKFANLSLGPVST